MTGLLNCLKSFSEMNSGIEILLSLPEESRSATVMARHDYVNYLMGRDINYVLMNNIELKKRIAVLDEETVFLKAQYTRAQQETYSFDKRREIRTKLREVAAKVKLLIAEIV